MTVPAKKDTGFVEAIEPGTQRTGALLAAAREAAGIDLVDLARESRVPLRHLKAIEADSHASLPALPYTVGFVKTFARAVGLDAEAVALQFRSETSKVPHVPTVPSLEPLDERRVPSRGLVVACVAIIALIIAVLSAWGAGTFDAAPKTAPRVAVVVPDAPVEAPVGDVGMAASASVPVPGVVTAAAVAAGTVTGTVAGAAGPVVLTAIEDVWVKIYDKTTRTSAKIGILRTGESFTVPAESQGMQLWTGKAGALKVTVGGKLLPPLGGPVETVRDVSLAGADLLARTAPLLAPTSAIPGV